MSERDYGQKAYEGYVRYSHGKSLISGAVLPSWEDQAEEIQNAWNEAAKAVLEAHYE